MSAPLTVREFAAQLGFTDGWDEPTPTLRDLVDPLQQALHDAQQHTECPVVCEPCGERLADTWCEHCNGSGVDLAESAASMAHAECEWCAGAQKVHRGCAEEPYAVLVAQRDAVLELHHLKRQTFSVPTFDEFDEPLQTVDGCTCGAISYPCATRAAVEGARA